MSREESKTHLVNIEIDEFFLLKTILQKHLEVLFWMIIEGILLKFRNQQKTTSLAKDFSIPPKLHSLFEVCGLQMKEIMHQSPQIKI